MSLCREGVASEVKGKFREINHGLIKRTTGVCQPADQLYVLHRFWQARILEPGIGNSKVEVEGGIIFTHHFSLDETAHSYFSFGFQLVERFGIDGRHQRQDGFEIHFRSIEGQIHVVTAVDELHPAIKRKRHRVQLHLIVGKGITFRVEVGIDIRINVHCHIVGVLETFTPEVERVGSKFGNEEGTIGCQVAIHAQVEIFYVCGDITLVVGIAHISAVDDHVVQFEIETHGAGIHRGSCIGFHDVPVSPAILQHMSQHFTVGEFELFHIITGIAKETFQINDQIDIAAKEQCIFREVAGSGDTDVFQTHRCIGEISDKTDFQLIEINLGCQLFVQFAAGYFGNFTPENQWQYQQDNKHQNNSGYNNNPVTFTIRSHNIEVYGD